MQGFTKLDRILKGSEFEVVYKKGKRLFSKHFSVTFLGTQRKRIGFSISAKVGGAVVRNRIRRVIRDLFRREPSHFPQGDCVIWVKPSSATLDNRKIREEIISLAKKFNE